MKKLAPIILFVYNRLEETQLTVKSLQKNFLSKESDLYIFLDGPKNNLDAKKIESVKKYIKQIEGFKNVTIFESKFNKGLAQSVIDGVSKIMGSYNKVIVLEDDLVVSKNFLNFMNESLFFYENNRKIFSISGYTLDLPYLDNYAEDYYLGYRASSWGWGTWKHHWDNIDWDIKDYSKFKYNILSQIRFSRGGSDMPGMLRKQMSGKIDSWAIRWCYNQYKKDLLTVFPSVSKLNSIGFGDNATNTKSITKFQTKIDKSNKKEFLFSNKIKLEKKILKQFSSKFSILERLKNKLR